MLAKIAERRNPRTKAAVDQLLERYLDQFDGAESTLTLYGGYVRKPISPYPGRLKAGPSMRTSSTPAAPSCVVAVLKISICTSWWLLH